MRVAVTFNDDERLARGAPGDAAAVVAVAEAARAVAQACRELGHEVELVPLRRDLPALAAKLAELSGWVVFNLVEGLGGEPRLEAAVAWLYELAGLAYTGSPPEALSLCLDKPVAKSVLRRHGVPLAEDRVLERGDEPLRGLRFPAIVKPARQDASHGVTLESVVTGEAAARARAAEVIERYGQPALVEEFLPGRELNVAVLGTGRTAEALPPGETDFSAFPAGAPPLVTYTAKWKEGSPEHRGTEPVPARHLPPALAEAVRTTAVDSYRALGLRGYGRVDLRLDADGLPRVLEVNPNPDLSPDAGFALAARRIGVDHAQLISRILVAAASPTRGS